MRADELKGRAVVTLADATKIGRIDDVLFDKNYRTVLGFRVKAGMLSHAEALPRAGVSAIGPDAVTVADQSAVNNEDRFAELAGSLSLDSAQRMKVVTEGGELLGMVNFYDVLQAREHELSEERHRERFLRVRLFRPRPRPESADNDQANHKPTVAV